MDRDRDLRSIWRAHKKASLSVPIDIRIGLSGSYTLDPVVPFIGTRLLESGHARPAILNANYNQCVRVCLDPASEFGTDGLDVIVLLWRLEDLADPALSSQLAEGVDLLLDAISVLCARFEGTVITALPPRPRPVIEGMSGFSRPSTLQQLWFSTLSRIGQMAGQFPNLFTVDTEALIAEIGETAALDHRKELLYRQPYTERLFVELGEAVARILRTRKAAAKKCLVLDCDNTLWGGIVGEDGVHGIEISDDMPGLAFRRFQSQVVALRQSGIFVALNSKNNPEDVWDVFDTHSGMTLKRRDISTARINWRPKSENLKEIAADLNIGIDALVFIDDSIFEIEEVRANAPEVTVFHVPADPADLPGMMREVARSFDRLEITDDDRNRVDMMQVETQRRDLRQKMTEDEFLASLGLEVFLYRPKAADLGRVTQLINKTNQFNVTTRRYSHDDVNRFSEAQDIDLFCASVRDKFGEYGLVGVAIVRHGEHVSEFDTLLMSCRVLGRGIETAIIAHGKEMASKRGSQSLRGSYLPTKKNQMVEDLFERHGFERLDDDEDTNAQVWELSAHSVSIPAFLTVHRRHPNRQE